MFDRLKKIGTKTKPVESGFDGLNSSRNEFFDAVRALTEPHGIQDLYPQNELARIGPVDRQMFLNDLRLEINDPFELGLLKKRLADQNEQAQAQVAKQASDEKRALEQQQEIERKRSESAKLAEQKAAEAVQEAESRRAEEQLEFDQMESASPTKKKANKTAKKKAVRKAGPRQSIALNLTPAERKDRSEENLDTVLNWLRQEPYSTIENVALMTGMGRSGARKLLNKLVKGGWLTRDELDDWPGVAGDYHLFGVSQQGLNQQKMVGGVELVYDRVFRRGKTKSSGGPHILRLQQARIYLQLIDNPNNEFRPYTLDRDLPFFGDKFYHWPKYPDGIIENSHLEFPNQPGQMLTIGIELERSGKGEERYSVIYKNHISNINEPSDEHNLSGRYDIVYYFLKSRRVADNMRIAFDEFIDKSGHDANMKHRFIFDTYADLPERIEALHETRS